jgi:hypothetical protein
MSSLVLKGRFQIIFDNIRYINDLPKTIHDKTVPVLFTDDTSIMVKSPNSKDFQTSMVIAFISVNKWFEVTLLSINGDKTHYIPVTIFSCTVCYIWTLLLATMFNFSHLVTTAAHKTS